MYEKILDTLITILIRFLGEVNEEKRDCRKEWRQEGGFSKECLIDDGRKYHQDNETINQKRQ